MSEVSWLLIAEDYVGPDGPVLDAIRAAQVLEKREPLVADVLAAIRAYISGEYDHSSRAEARTRVMDACRRLEDWKP